MFYVPNYLGHADNYIPANPGVTPAHIVPEWYFLPFYAILRAVPDKLGGVIAMFGALVVLIFLPWLDGSKVRSAAYRPLVPGVLLGLRGGLHLARLARRHAAGGHLSRRSPRSATVWYFAHFFIIVPALGYFEKPKPLPDSISEAVLRLRHERPSLYARLMNR